VTDISTAKSILILGFGREGRSVYDYLSSKINKSVKLGIYDRNPLGKLKLNSSLKSRVSLHLGTSLSPTLLAKYDLIIKSPGIPNKSIPSKFFAKITSPTQIFFENCPAPIIGITGTKGKSTTSSLIHQILSKAGKDAVLLGNIGVPALNYLNEIHNHSLVVFELSCHQLSLLTQSPTIAVLLPIYPEHLDYYQTFADYLEAKSHIVKYQKINDYVIYYADNKDASKLASESLAQKIPVYEKDAITNNAPKPKLQGPMNQINIAIAKKVIEQFGISTSTADDVIQHFTPLPYRLEYIGEYQRIKFYNDSLATVPQATIQAIHTLGDQVETIMLGGYDRHIDYTPLAKILLSSKIKNLILFPPVGQIIWDLMNNIYSLKAHNFHPYFVKDMKSAIQTTYTNTSKGKICLLSPGASSFSNFRNYQDRGDQFKKYAKELSHS